MVEIVNSTLIVELVTRVDRGAGSVDERRIVLPAQELRTCEGGTVSAIVAVPTFHLDDLIPADEMRVPRSFVDQAGEIVGAILPAFRELETKYATAVRALGQAPNLTMQLDAASIEALAAALSPTITVEAPTVNVENTIETPPREITVKRDPRSGLIESALVEDVV
jgi:hypothetical protein